VPSRPPAAEAGARVEHHLQVHLAALAARDAQDLALGEEAATLRVREQHEVDEDERARRALEPRLEHVRAREIGRVCVRGVGSGMKPEMKPPVFRAERLNVSRLEHVPHPDPLRSLCTGSTAGFFATAGRESPAR
jgi:hypothetical protein